MTASGFRGDAAWRRLTFPTLGTVAPRLAWGPHFPTPIPNPRQAHEGSGHLSESTQPSGVRRTRSLPCLLVSPKCEHLCMWVGTYTRAVRFPKSFIFLTYCLQPQFLAYILFFLMPHPVILFLS